MRTAAKRDTPEKACIQEAERLNAEVFRVSGPGLLDTLVAYEGNLWWVEVKRPGEPLKPRQEAVLLRLYLADVSAYVVENPAQMRALIEGRLAPWSPGSRPVEGKKKREHRPGYDRARTVDELCAVPCCPLSHLPTSRGCSKHDGTQELRMVLAINGQLPRESATVENGLLPAPRKGVSGRRVSKERP